MSESEDRKTLLLVDDAPANIQVANAILKDDYRVRVATSGAKALELVKAKPAPDLILLDVEMPEMDGYEVCRRLKTDPETREIPVIFLTGKTEAEDETRGFSVGAVDYIHKPFSPSVVQARVQTHLALRETREQLARQLSAIQHELEMARKIQLSILPREVPRVEGVEIAARYVPMTSVAGDFYDFIPVDDKRFGALVADVSGHGVPAALVASMLKIALAAQSPHASDPARVLAGLNQALCGKFATHFVTAAYLFVDTGEGDDRLCRRRASPPRALRDVGRKRPGRPAERSLPRHVPARQVFRDPGADRPGRPLRGLHGRRVGSPQPGGRRIRNRADPEPARGFRDQPADPFADRVLDTLNAWTSRPRGRGARRRHHPSRDPRELNRRRLASDRGGRHSGARESRSTRLRSRARAGRRVEEPGDRDRRNEDRATGGSTARSRRARSRPRRGRRPSSRRARRARRRTETGRGTEGPARARASRGRSAAAARARRARAPRRTRTNASVRDARAERRRGRPSRIRSRRHREGPREALPRPRPLAPVRNAGTSAERDGGVREDRGQVGSRETSARGLDAEGFRVPGEAELGRRRHVAERAPRRRRPRGSRGSLRRRRPCGSASSG